MLSWQIHRFVGKEQPQIQHNFPIQSNATEMLFLQHFMKYLEDGRLEAGLIVPEGVLFQTNNAFTTNVKKELLENFNAFVHCEFLREPYFLPYAGVSKTNFILFQPIGSTHEIFVLNFQHRL